MSKNSYLNINDQVINKVKLDIQKNNIQQAINALLPMYDKKVGFPVTTLLTKCYFLRKHFIDAKNVAYENINDFLHSFPDFKLLMLVLIKNKEFIKAREIAEQIHHVSYKWYEESLNIISNGENIFLKNEPKYLKKITNDFYHMSFNNTLYEQKKTLLKGERIPFKKFVNYAKYLLLDPFVREIIKSELIDTLRKINYQDTVKLRWIDDNFYSIDISCLKPLSELESYNRIMDNLDTDYAQNDPIIYFKLRTYFEYQSIILYPLNDMIIKNVNEWYNLSINLYLDSINFNLNNHNNYYKLISSIMNEFSEMN